MARHKRSWTFIPAVLFVSAGAVTAAGSIFYSETGSPGGQTVALIGVTVMPGAVAKRAMMPPAATTVRARSAGKKSLEVSTANSPADDDGAWLEELDFDGDGTVEQASLVWDDEDKVLYAFSSGTFACKTGGTATADLLVAAYGPHNSRNRPPGSGFWVANLDKGACAAEASGLWGCKFDGSGNATACGAARVDARNDDLIILTATH
jgi:hypothetical protein